MMSKVPTDVVGHEHESSQDCLPHTVSGDAAINVGTQAAMFRNRAKSIDQTPHGKEWKQPQKEINEWMTTDDQHRQNTRLHREYLQLCISRTGIAVKQGRELGAH